MSHLHERAEKNCLNCNSEVQGRYCHNCGQENIAPVETAWHLVTHFFNDITHFDGKFFTTLKYLVLRPGYLTTEYKLGRRARYLNPVRMYLFTSAIFFLVFFSVSHVGDDMVKRTYMRRSLEDIQKMDSTQFLAFTKELNEGVPMTHAQFQHYADSSDKAGGINFGTSGIKSKASYDSLATAGKIKDNWFQRKLAYKSFEINEKYEHRSDAMLKALFNKLLHSFPQMLFVSLPLVALLLKLLYVRKKNYYYSGHVIFTIHLYVFVFILMLMVIMFQQMNKFLHWEILKYMVGGLVLYALYYQYRAMYNYYQQRHWKTILKYLLLHVMLLIMEIVLFIFFTFFSLFNL